MTPYQTDFYQWLQDQADLLRVGELAALDIENLIEEIESVGRSEKRELENRLRVLLMHLLKWKYQSENRCRSWSSTINVQRRDFLQVLADSPSLKRFVPEFIDRSYPYAVDEAVEETTILKKNFPIECPWTQKQILDKDWFPLDK